MILFQFLDNYSTFFGCPNFLDIYGRMIFFNNLSNVCCFMIFKVTTITVLDPKFMERQICANSVEPDQGLHYLSFHLHDLDLHLW